MIKWQTTHYIHIFIHVVCYFVLNFRYKTRYINSSQRTTKNILKSSSLSNLLKEKIQKIKGYSGTCEASEAKASPEFRGFSTEKFLTSWIYEGGNFSCFTGKKLVPTPLHVVNEKILPIFYKILACKNSAAAIIRWAS